MSGYQKTLPHLQVELQGSVLWLTLDNPQQSHAISSEMVSSLVQVLFQAESDPHVRVVVIGSSGSVFCAGGDIKAMSSRTGMFAGDSNELRVRYQQGIQQMSRAMEALSKPVIAMVQGAAVGAGCDLAMMCDLRIGSEMAQFGETFAKLNLVPGDGGSFFLQRVIGYAKAMQMTLTAELIGGEKALQWGLLTELVKEADLRSATEALAQKIAANGPMAVQMAKKAMKIAYLHDLSTTLDLLAAYQGIAQRTDDHVEALAAFKEKRRADFKNS